MPKTNYKNNLFLDALAGKQVSRPPVWMMRQAGRYLPDFMALKHKYSFFERVENPDLATQITLMPIDQIGVDAAIVFSDILTIPQALGYEVQMPPGKGPYLPKTIETPADVDKIEVPNMAFKLTHVYKAVSQSVSELNGRVPLIGFAGAPWTVFCYMVEGSGSKNFAKARAFAFEHPEAAAKLLDKITCATDMYLVEQIKAGAAVVQLFDSWGGLLSPDDYAIFSYPYIKRLIKSVSEHAPVIAFAKGVPHHINAFVQAGAAAIGVDWSTAPAEARRLAGPSVTLQGNFDPARLLSPIADIKKLATKMVDEFGAQRYIANLGHGILPNIPVDHAKAFVDTIKNYAAKQ